MTAAPILAPRAASSDWRMTPGRTASLVAHVAIGAALLALPGPQAPQNGPPVIVVDIAPPLPIPLPPPPPPPKRTKAEPRPPAAATSAPPPPVLRNEPEAEAIPNPVSAPRAEKLAPAKAAPAAVAEARADDAPFVAAQADRADALRAATAATPSLNQARDDAPWIGAAADRIEPAPGPASAAPARNLEMKAAPDQVQFAGAEDETPEDQKRREDEARRRAGLSAPTSPNGDAPLSTGGRAVTTIAPTGGASGGGGTAGPRAGGGLGAAIRGLSVDGLNESYGCANPDDPRLSDEERAACNRKRWAGARGAPELGPVAPRKARTFDAAAAAKSPATGRRPV
jgi:hypothetical protein